MTLHHSLSRPRGVGTLAALLTAVAVTACGPTKPPPTLSPEGTFRWAVEKMKAGDYGAAEQALGQFLYDQPLHPLADSAQLLLGETHFKQGDYIEASEAFARLAQNRPTSPLADDAQLGVCRSYWRLAPDLEHDQDYTRRALDACERMLEFYTPSPLEDEARDLRRRARHRLAAYRYRIARWYYDQGAYESANIYLKEIVDQYPSAPVAPEAMLTLYRSYRELGFDSEADDIRQRLLDEHGDTEQARRLREEGGVSRSSGP